MNKTDLIRGLISNFNGDSFTIKDIQDSSVKYKEASATINRLCNQGEVTKLKYSINTRGREYKATDRLKSVKSTPKTRTDNVFRGEKSIYIIEVLDKYFSGRFFTKRQVVNICNKLNSHFITDTLVMQVSERYSMTFKVFDASIDGANRSVYFHKGEIITDTNDLKGKEDIIMKDSNNVNLIPNLLNIYKEESSKINMPVETLVNIDLSRLKL